MQTSLYGLNLKLKSGHPCLEFTNTVGNHASEHPGETLFGYEDLLNWGKRVGLLNEGQVERLGRQAKRRMDEAARVFEESLELREALYRVFVALTREDSPDEADLKILNQTLAPLTDGAHVSHYPDGFKWEWTLDPTALDAPLRLIALAGMDLLTSEYASRVGQCADQDGCGWLFVDTTKNHSRRWCDINDCGNRAKQRRYQERARGRKSK